MPTRPVFRCQFCDASPDHGTQRSLQGQVTERMFGEYLDAFPGRWLVWNGGGPLGPRRYACREHRGDLVAYLRYHYATVAAQVWKMPPYEQRWPDEKRPHMGGSMGIIKFGLRGGLLQDSPPAAAAGEPAPPEDAGEAPSGTSPRRDGAPEEAASPTELARSLGEHPVDESCSPEELGELFPPGQLFPPAELFPPGDPLTPDEPFPPTDGPGQEPAGGARSPGDGPWPPDEGPWPEGGPWPPGFPPGEPPRPDPEPPPAA